MGTTRWLPKAEAEPMGPHLSSHGPLEKSIGDVRRVFGGEILFAEELLAFDV